MQISRTTIRLAQTYLKQGGFKPGAVDGVSGPKTGKALERALKARGNKAPAAWKNWPRTRRLICFLQLTAIDHGIDAGPVDGIPGPVTNNAIDELKHFTEHGELPAPFRDVTPSNKNPNNWPKQTQSALTAFYGPHCKTSNFTRVNCPYTLRLAWDVFTKVTETLSFGHKGELYPSLDDKDDVYGLASTYFEAVISESMIAKLSWLITYDNTPTVDEFNNRLERTDNLYLLTVGWKF